MPSRTYLKPWHMVSPSCSHLLLPSSLILLTLLSTLHAVEDSCALYEPPAPGIHCLHSDQVLGALTESKWVWLLELYSSWCGHCQKFAPRLKELAKELEAWSEFIRIGVMDCTVAQNRDKCNQLQIQAFPTIRMFLPFDSKPLDYKSVQVGAGKTNEQLRHWIVDHIVSVNPHPSGWPNFETWTNADMVKEDAASWTPSVFVFEEAQSYLGKELILDFSHVKSVRVRRVLADSNTALIWHYSILEFPSAVVELKKGHFHVIPVDSVEDARSQFKSKISAFLQTAGVKLSAAGSVGFLDKASPDHAPQSALTTQPHSLGNRVELSDLLSTISYALRAEVPLHVIISGSAYSALYNFITLLEQAFSRVGPGGVSASLLAVRLKLDGRNQAGFITNKEWHRIMDSKLDSALFPTRVTWKACNGSLPHLRGYPCGLWMLMHTISLLTLPVSHAHHPSSLPGPPNSPLITSTRALTIMSHFVQHFFSCEVCRMHFTEMARSLPQVSLMECGEAILWLWEAHNTVNARLRLEGGGDPTHPKVLFPSISRCPYCYRKAAVTSHGVSPDFNNTGFVSGESLLVGMAGPQGMLQATPQEPRHVLRARQLKAVMEEYVWNRTAVLLYLWNFYHLEPKYENGTQQHRLHIPPYAIVQAAWPRKYGVGHDQFYKRYLVRAEQGDAYDPEVCLTWFVVCVLCVSFLVFWFQRKRRCRNLFRW